MSALESWGEAVSISFWDRRVRLMTDKAPEELQRSLEARCGKPLPVEDLGALAGIVEVIGRPSVEGTVSATSFELRSGILDGIVVGGSIERTAHGTRVDARIGSSRASNRLLLFACVFGLVPGLLAASRGSLAAAAPIAVMGLVVSALLLARGWSARAAERELRAICGEREPVIGDGAFRSAQVRVETPAEVEAEEEPAERKRKAKVKSDLWDPSEL